MPERVKKLRDFFGVPKPSDFRSLEAFRNSPVTTWLLLFVFAMAATFIMTFSLQRVPKTMEEGMIATRDIKADRNYEIVDEETTNKLKEEAARAIPTVYNYNVGSAKTVIQRVHDAFEAVRSQAQSFITKASKKKQRPAAEILESNANELNDVFSNAIGIDVSPGNFHALLKENFGIRTEQEISFTLNAKLTQPIIAEKGILAAEGERGIILRHIRHEGEEIKVVEEAAVSDPSQILTTADVRDRIAKMTIPHERFKTPQAPSAIIALAQALVEPNISFDYEETDSRRKEAELSVQDVIIKVKTGEMIVRNGSRFEERHIKILSGIRKENSRGAYPLEFLGTMLFIILSLIIMFYFAERYIRRFHPSRKDYLLMGTVALINIAVMRIGFSIVPVIHDVLLVEVPLSALLYAVPVATGAMLLRMYLHAEDAFIFAVFSGLATSLFAETDLAFVIYSFIPGIVGITAIAHTDRRSAIIKAGAITGGVGAIAILGIKLIGMAAVATQLNLTDIFWHMICAFCGGLWCAILILIISPLIESLLGYTSDIKLLELANLNHPLLRELIVRAPGTYHHSHLVGILAEAAAESIGANPLLVRVGAYYHDVGKIRKPLYFVENTKEGEDRHAKLSPHMSALIVSSHVKEGMEMGTEAGLPKSIVDMIPQHHGTRPIGFFYEKAKAQKAENVTIDEADFHYPGPKPQTREAAILMLADVAEAAVRSLKEKGTARIQQTVQRVINDCFADEQLNECELTLYDLNEIAKAFAHILFGIYHQRIEYPKDARSSDVSVVDKESFVEHQPSQLPSAQTPGAKGRL